MFSIIWAAAALILVGLIFQLFNWGFDTSDAGLKRYAAIFAIIVVVMAAFSGFTTTALVDAALSWVGYMVGLLVLRALNAGRDTPRRP